MRSATRGAGALGRDEHVRVRARLAELIGTPPHRYLLETRLRAAAVMLREGRSVTETCFACGFNNLSHFSRIFSRYFGCSPSAYPVRPD